MSLALMSDPPPRKPKVKESPIRKALKKRVEAYGGTIRAVSWLGRRNAPDVLALFPETSLYGALRAMPDQPNYLHPFIETKRPGKDATAAQAREHEAMREAGCVVIMVRSFEELDAWLPPL